MCILQSMGPTQLWNIIPNNLRNIDDYRSFKHGLKELDLASLWSLICHLT